MAALTLCGAGGHGRDVAQIVKAAYPMVPIVFLDDNADLGYMPTSMLTLADSYLLGFNSPRLREEFDKREGATYVLHPYSSIAQDCKLQAGVVVGPLCAIGPEVSFGRHVHVGAKVSITRATVGDFTTISPGADICGDVTIGRRCSIGAGAIICNLVTIEDDVTVGAGAVVLPNTVIESGQTVVGVPARAWVTT